MQTNELVFKYPPFIKHAYFNDDKYSIIVAGRRVGKTYNAAQWICDMLLLEDNKAGLWVDTTQNNLRDYIDIYFKKILKNINHLMQYDLQRKVITLPNGSYIHLRSAERPENLEGFEYDYAVLNEGGIILKKPSLWEISIMPMVRNARTKIVGTPKGKNLFHKLYSMGQDPESEYKSYHFSSYASPYFDNSQLDKLRYQVPESAFRQNYLAEFVDDAGSVFRNISHCIRAPKEGLPSDIMAIDLAKHQDFTVIMAANQAETQITEIDRFNQIDWTFQKNRIVAMWERLGKPKVIVDSTGAGDPIFDDLRNYGMLIEGYRFTNKSKAELIQGLSVSMDNGAIYFPNNPTLISELEVFEFDTTPSGNIRYNAPEGMHDDMVISLALANYLMRNKKTVTINWI